jgi:hypothetical protein
MKTKGGIRRFSMKSESIKSTAQDRLATGDEIRRAMSYPPDAALQLCSVGGVFEIDSESGGVVRFPVEELQFFAYLGEQDDQAPN